MSNEKPNTCADPPKGPADVQQKQKLERTRTSGDSILNTVQRNLQSGLNLAHGSIQSGLKDAHRNFKDGLDSAREGLKSGVGDARRNVAEGIETARVNIDFGLESMREGINFGITQVHGAVSGTSSGSQIAPVTRDVEYIDEKVALQEEDERDHTLVVMVARLERQIEERGLLAQRRFEQSPQENGIVPDE
jgi:hypothetical protein